MKEKLVTTGIVLSLIVNSLIVNAVFSGNQNVIDGNGQKSESQKLSSQFGIQKNMDFRFQISENSDLRLNENVNTFILDEPETIKEYEEVDVLSDYASTTEQESVNMVSWDFNEDGNSEGWTGNIRIDPNVTVQDGSITFVSLGSNETREPSIYSPICSIDDEINTTEYNTLKIRLKNLSSATSLYFYYTTYADDSSNFSSERRVAIPIQISDEFIEYTIDFRTEENWNWYFKQFMITMGGADGTLIIDYIRLTQEDYGWNFDDNTPQGWTGNIRTSTPTVSSGVLSVNLLGNENGREPALYSSNKMFFEMTYYTKAKIRIKNMTNADTFYFYYTTRNLENDVFDSSRRVSVSVTPNCNEFKEYVINFYNEGSWIGTFGQFMITMGGAEGTIEIDELIFEKNVKADNTHWYFEDNSLEGWRTSDEETGTARHSISVEDGCLKIVRNDSGVGSVFTPDGMNLRECDLLVLGVKSASDSPSISVYFKGDREDYTENDIENRMTCMRHLELTETLVEKEYIIDLSYVNPGWQSGYVGVIDELMFITTGTIYLDYVYIAPRSSDHPVTLADEISITAETGNKNYVLIPETLRQSNEVHKYTVTYDPAVLEISDVCALTYCKDLQTSGNVPNTDIEVVSNVPGTLVFKINGISENYVRKLANVIEFTALDDGETSVNFSFE